MEQKEAQLFKEEVAEELQHLLCWWKTYAPDYKNGGFFGKIDQYNQVEAHAPKGLVLTARILYTFSTAYRHTGDLTDLVMAERAYEFLTTHLLDQLYGGFYWSADYLGNPSDDKKQVYGQAFAIYGLSAYYQATHDLQALALARQTFSLLEKYSFDVNNLGYIEAHTRNWQTLTDLRLSEKDLNEKKSMNTHLHVIEAYAALYQVWKNEDLKKAVELLLSNFESHIIDPETYHLNLFFTETWEVRSGEISFGHDIEAAWLLQEAAEVIRHDIAGFKNLAVHMADASVKGLHAHGGLVYEYHPQVLQQPVEFHWWPQAEALVGFFNAFENTNDNKYLTYVSGCWKFIQTCLKDKQNGEWLWGVEGDQLRVMPGQDKAGFWKCPYHNCRALMELLRRMKEI